MVNLGNTSVTGRSQRWVLTLVTLGLLLVIVMAIAAATGPAQIRAVDVAKMLIQRLPGVSTPQQENWPASHSVIVFRVRLPRIILAAMVGGGLAMAGATYQGLLQNPMADPYIIGISAGASLGAAVGVILREWSRLLRTIHHFDGLWRHCLLPLLCTILPGLWSCTYRPCSWQGCVNAAFCRLCIFDGISQPILEIVYWMIGSLSGRGWAHVRASLPYGNRWSGGIGLLRLNIVLGKTAEIFVNVELTKVVLLTAVHWLRQLCQ